MSNGQTTGHDQRQIDERRAAETEDMKRVKERVQETVGGAKTAVDPPEHVQQSPGPLPRRPILMGHLLGKLARESARLASPPPSIGRPCRCDLTAPDDWRSPTADLSPVAASVPPVKPDGSPQGGAQTIPALAVSAAAPAGCRGIPRECVCPLGGGARETGQTIESSPCWGSTYGPRAQAQRIEP
jgi:hypothetical protein